MPIPTLREEGTMRTDITFKTEDGATLRGWFYQPDDRDGPFPTLVMAHGFSAIKEQGLDEYATVFCQGGFAALVYDHRNLGTSDGEPRGEIIPYDQLRDYRDAITFALTLPVVDQEHIGIWGTSYSGGHVIVVAAIDRRVKCVVAQFPYLGGSKTPAGS
jgi:cephalosporin-C deacetylase-like acetyl esterase